MNEVETILSQLTGHAGWVSALVTWLFTAQTFAKLIQPKVTELFTRLFARVLETDGTEDEARLVSMLGCFRYWIINEFLDLVFRVKLPTLTDFKKLSATKPQTSTP